MIRRNRPSATALEHLAIHLHYGDSSSASDYNPQEETRRCALCADKVLQENSKGQGHEQ